MVLGLGLGEYVAPQLEFRAEIAKSQAQGLAVGLSRYGHWERDGNLFVHFNSIETFGVLYGVTIFEFDDEERLLRQITAQTAVYQGAADAEQEPGKKHPWQLEHGTELGFDHSGAEVQNSHSDFDTRAIELDLTPSLLQVLVIVPASMRTSDLWRFANRFEQQQEDAGRYFLAFWKKALQPLNTAVLVLVAISFIFGPLRSASMGSRVFSAVVLGLVVTLVQRLLQELSLVYHLPPLSAVLIPILLCFVAGVMLLQRRA
jgi:lipopolysaccharide export system permease protein